MTSVVNARTKPKKENQYRLKRPPVNVSIYSAEVLMADPLTFTSLAAVPGYGLPLLAVQWRTAGEAALAFAPLFTTTWKYV